jgi:TrbL/VirB6 plasmid conjugal transfer protein
VWKAVGWAFRGFDIADIFFTASQIAICGFLIVTLPTVLPIVFDGARFIGGALMTGIAGLPLEAGGDASIPQAMVDFTRRYSFKVDCEGKGALPGECFINSIGAMLGAITAGILMPVLGIAALIVDIWGFWGCVLAIAVSSIFVPFLLYERLQFLFDGWLRFFVGMLVYMIIARVNIGLVALAIMSYLGYAASDLLTPGGLIAMVLPVTKIQDTLGMVMMLGVGLFSLFATGGFARAVVSGAGGGGVQFGAMMRATSGFVSGAATAGAVVGAGIGGAMDAPKEGGLKGMASSAGSAALDKLVETQKDNRDFKAGYAIGRETMAGAMNGGRGLYLGGAADASQSAITKVENNAWQRATTALASAAAGAGAGARTASVLAMGGKAQDSFANARMLASERDRSEQAVKSASQSLDKVQAGLTDSQQQAFRDAIKAQQDLGKVVPKAGDVRAQAEALRAGRNALGETARSMKLSAYSAMEQQKTTQLASDAARLSDRMGSKLSDGNRAGLQSRVEQAERSAQALRDTDKNAELSAQADSNALAAKGLSQSATSRITAQAQVNLQTQQGLRDDALNKARQDNAAVGEKMKEIKGEASAENAATRAQTVGMGANVKLEEIRSWVSEDTFSKVEDRLAQLDEDYEKVSAGKGTAADTAQLRESTDDLQDDMRVALAEAKQAAKAAKDAEKEAAKSGKPRLREKISDKDEDSASAA